MGIDHRVETVEVTIVETAEIVCAIARAQIVVALQNVIRNALDAVLELPTPASGMVAITVTQRPDTDLEVIISDDGIGIDEDDLNELRCYVPGRLSKKNRGTGFGLPIVRRIVDAHGGALIEIDSVRGTTVVIRLPAGD
jgi:two-component system nitrogen regulation sensor histidine kinase NtrY